MTRITHLQISGFGVFKEPLGLKLEAGRFVILAKNEDSAAADSNGAGKTTIFKALSWCLYGKTIDQLDAPKVIHHGSKKASVKVWLEVDGKHYRVTRERTPKTGKLRLEEMTPPPGSKVAEDHTQSKMVATQQAIHELVGLEWDAFRCVVLFGQGDNARFASPTMTDAARKAVLSSVLKLDVYEQAREKAKDLRGIARDQLSFQRAKESDLKLKLQNVSGELKLCEQRLGDLKERKKRASITSSPSTAEDLEVELAALDEEFFRLEEELLGVKEELEEVDELLQKAVELKAKRKGDLRQARTRADELATKGECPSCGQDRPYDEERHSAALAQVKRAEKKLGKARGSFDELAGDRKGLREEWSSLEAKIRKSSSTRSRKAAELKTVREESERREAELAAIKEEEEALTEKRKKLKDQGVNVGLEARGIIEEIKRLEGRVALADWWVHGFGPKGVPAFAIEQSLPALNKKANRHLLALADGDIEVTWTATTTGSSGAVKEMLTQNLVVEGVPDAAPSGGQSKKIELATELALSELVQEREGTGVNVLLLDEALDGLDREGQDRVVEWVHRDLPHETVFVVSHDETIAESFDKRLVVHKDGGQSTASWE